MFLVVAHTILSVPYCVGVSYACVGVQICVGVGSGPSFTLASLARYMCYRPEHSKQFKKCFGPSVVLEGAGKIKADGIVPYKLSWALVKHVTRWLEAARCGPQSNLPADVKLRIHHDFSILCGHFQNLEDKHVRPHRIYGVITGIWQEFNHPLPDLLSVWNRASREGEIFDAVNAQAEYSFRQRASGGSASRPSRGRAKVSGYRGSFGGGSAGRAPRGRSRSRGRAAVASARAADPRHNAAIPLPSRTLDDGKGVCVYFNKGNCLYSGPGQCRWHHVCIFCGISKKPYFECGCAGALAHRKPAPIAQ